jgi:hypothetical protein
LVIAFASDGKTPFVSCFLEVADVKLHLASPRAGAPFLTCITPIPNSKKQRAKRKPELELLEDRPAGAMKEV